MTMAPFHDHPDDEILARFVEGLVPESDLPALGQHLDDCPACAARCRMLDPFETLFSTHAPPPLPMDLVAEILAEVDGVAQVEPPTPAPTTRWPAWLPVDALGGGLLMAAAALVAFGPGEDGALAEIAPRIAAQVGGGVPSPLLCSLLLAGGLFVGMALGRHQRP